MIGLSRSIHAARALARRPIFFAAVAAASAAATATPLSAPPAAAQQTGPAEERDGPPLGILVINTERVFAESAAARSIRDQTEAYGRDAQARFNLARAELTAEESALTELRNDPGDRTEEFEARATAFEARVRALRRARSQVNEALRRARTSAREQLERELQEVLRGLMADRGAQAIFDARVVVARFTALDVTQDAIEALDARIARIELTLPPLATP